MCDYLIVNLSEWAEKVGVSKFTAYRWFREGRPPVPAQRVGRLILVDVAGGDRSGGDRVVLYARVSSYDQRSDLDRQVARLTTWATAQGMAVTEVVTEVGSGMNAKRRRLARVLADSSVSTLVVEHRDRLARFGVEYLEAALSAQGRRIAVVDPGEVDPGEVDDDLVRDMTEVLTCFCARLYGRRGARNRAIKALGCAKNDIGPAALSQPGARV
jgi:putative resolvase